MEVNVVGIAREISGFDRKVRPLAESVVTALVGTLNTDDTFLAGVMALVSAEMSTEPYRDPDAIREPYDHMRACLYHSLWSVCMTEVLARKISKAGRRFSEIEALTAAAQAHAESAQINLDEYKSKVVTDEGIEEATE